MTISKGFLQDLKGYTHDSHLGASALPAEGIMVISRKWVEVQCACAPSRKFTIHFCALEDSSTQTNLTSREDTASKSRDYSAGASVHVAGARSLYVTTTTGGYFAIQISSQTTKKEIFETPLLRTIIPRKLLTFCDTITFAPVPSQVLHNSQT